MYRPTRVSLKEAMAIVKERVQLPDGRANPLHMALCEGKISIEVKDGVEWQTRDAEWYEQADIWWPNRLSPNYLPREGQPSATNTVMVKSDDIDRLWPEPSQKKPVVLTNNKGNREKYDLRGLLIFLAAEVYLGHIDPQKIRQADLMQIMRDWFNKHQGAEPVSDSDLKEVAGQFLQAHRAGGLK